MQEVLAVLNGLGVEVVEGRVVRAGIPHAHEDASFRVRKLDLLNRDRQAVLRLRLAHLGRRRSWRRSSQCINHLRGVRYHRYCAHVAAERVLAGELVLD